MDKKDILLLTLHKQHYMDKHTEPYVSRISCLGYYDEISIDVVEEDVAECPLTKSIPFNPFSNIWYRTGKKNVELQGGYSNLCVGLLRGIDGEDRNDYWEKEQELPYFGLGFVKLDDAIDFSTLVLEIEDDGFLFKDADEFCHIINYCTLDSADVVVFIKSNKMSLIEDAFCKIEKKVAYLHSILGIDETFLVEFHQSLMEENKKDSIIETGLWNGKRCNLDEKISNINIRLAAKGSDKVRCDILKEWNAQREKIKCSNDKCTYTLGHENLVIDINETNVESLVYMLVENGFLTHTNPLYSHGVYNIETSFSIKGENITIDDEPIEFSEIEEKREWYCDSVLGEYEELIKNHPIKKDDGYYSYSQALLLTLNAVAQYEKFEMSKDLFWLIYPSLHMFNAHMIENWNGLNSTSSEYIKKVIPIKKAMCDYLEAVNSVIYHTVHTDQVYLMIPGYSGTSFSIPIKLSLFYMWFIDRMSVILNDDDSEYSCILIPVMEAKPSTGVIDIDKNNSNKIIYVRLSQRQLYFPRNLMFILAHELGHYIGRDIRCRKKRVEHILKSLMYCICEGLLPEDNPFIEKRIWDLFLKIKKPELQELVLASLAHDFLNNHEKTDFYANDISESLKKSILNVLSEDVKGNKVRECIYEISGDLKKYVCENEDYVERLKDVYAAQCYIEQNRRRIISDGVVNYIVNEIITIYREIFSDVVALEILQCDYIFAEEAFDVSEGVVYSDGKEVAQNIIRKRIMKKLFTSSENNQVEYYVSDNRGDITEYLIKNLFSFEWLEDSLTTYAKSCQEELQKRFATNPTIRDEVEEVRKVYSCFINDKITLSELYRIIINKNTLYMEGIKKQYDEYIKKGGG